MANVSKVRLGIDMNNGENDNYFISHKKVYLRTLIIELDKKGYCKSEYKNFKDLISIYFNTIDSVAVGNDENNKSMVGSMFLPTVDEAVDIFDKRIFPMYKRSNISVKSDIDKSRLNEANRCTNNCARYIMEKVYSIPKSEEDMEKDLFIRHMVPIVVRQLDRKGLFDNSKIEKLIGNNLITGMCGNVSLSDRYNSCNDVVCANIASLSKAIVESDFDMTIIDKTIRKSNDRLVSINEPMFDLIVDRCNTHACKDWKKTNEKIGVNMYIDL